MGYQLAQLSPEAVYPSSQRELGATALWLMRTGEFANPYILLTGPTAHLPPIYPAILSLIYLLLGRTYVAGYAGFLLIAATTATLYAMVPCLATTLGVGKQAGVLGGIAGALLVQWYGHGEALTAIVLGLLLVAFLQRWKVERITLGSSILLGMAWGVAFHLQPALLTVMLGCMAFELWWHRDRQKWVLVSTMALGAVLACIPWGYRN